VSDLRALQGKVTAIEEVTSAARSHWAIKLNVISDTLLRGVWLRKIVLDTDTFFIEGSAISTQRNEMANVHDFTSQLKESEGFLQGFDNFELGSIQRRKIGKTELADFLFTADLEIK
jgi:Tfp pilus assembly protein PilN